MKPIIALMFLIMIGCTSKEKQLEEYWDRQYNLLGELKDNKGRLIKKAESGWIPGEDIWLKITRFDTLGNITEEYGAKPYGTKYKEVFKYDSVNRVIEKWTYGYESRENIPGEFENYATTDYQLKDTLVSWSVTDKQLKYKVLFAYDDKRKMTRERQFYTELDSLTGDLKLLLYLDTLYQSESLDSSKENR